MPDTPLISVVEDDQPFRESMKALLMSLGYAVETFASAAAFLGFPRLAETACLISDINMPVMTGFELYRRLVDDGHAIPTIFVTAYPDAVMRARALEDGVVCYLPKPVDDIQLTSCVRAALQSRRPPEMSL